MVLKFSANLSFMFPENDNLLQRYESASKLGFKAVECAFPYEHSLDAVVQAKNQSQVQQILINAYPGMILLFRNFIRLRVLFSADFSQLQVITVNSDSQPRREGNTSSRKAWTKRLNMPRL